jgi:replicative DNA helicase
MIPGAIENGLPVSLESERFVLGSILLDGDVYGDAAGELDPDDFSLEKHRRMFKRMGELAARGEKIDRVTLYNELVRHNEQAACDGLSYLVSLDDGLPQLPSIESYIRIVKEKSTLRRIIFASQNLMQRALMAEDSAAEILEGAQSTLSGLGVGKGGKIVSTAAMIDEIGVESLLGPREAHGGPTYPWSELQRVLCGLVPGQITLLMAETSKGKTAFGMQVAAHAAMTNHPPVIWSKEIGLRSMFRRLVSQMSGSRLNAKGQYSFHELDAHRMAVNSLHDYPVYFDYGASKNVAALRGNLVRLRAKVKIGLVVVDYIQRIKGNPRISRAQQVSEISRDLADLAADLGLPVLVLSQVDRSAVKGKDAGIGLHSGKESGDLENDARVVLWINAPEEYSQSQPTPVQIHIGKQTEGPAGFDVPMVFVPDSQTFVEV